MNSKGLFQISAIVYCLCTLTGAPKWNAPELYIGKFREMSLYARM